jgi:hypothetical protein
MLFQSAETAKSHDSSAERKQPQSTAGKNGKRLRCVDTRWLSSTFCKWKNDHGNRLREFFLEIPARKIAIVWKQRVDAYAGLLRLDWVDVIFRFATLFTDSEDAQRRDCFKGVAGFRMHHTHANRREVAGVNNGNYHDERNNDAFGKYAGWGQNSNSSQ